MGQYLDLYEKILNPSSTFAPYTDRASDPERSFHPPVYPQPSLGTPSYHHTIRPTQFSILQSKTGTISDFLNFTIVFVKLDPSFKQDFFKMLVSDQICIHKSTQSLYSPISINPPPPLPHSSFVHSRPLGERLNSTYTQGCCLIIPDFSFRE